MMYNTAVHLKGAIEPLYLNEPLNATAMNMSAAAKNGLIFFGGKDTDDREVMVSIPNILFLRNEEPEGVN